MAINITPELLKLVADEDITTLIELDKNGFLIADEDGSQFAKRLGTYSEQNKGVPVWAANGRRVNRWSRM